MAQFNNVIEFTKGDARYRLIQMQDEWIIQQEDGSWWRDCGPSQVKVEIWGREDQNLGGLLVAG